MIDIFLSLSVLYLIVIISHYMGMWIQYWNIFPLYGRKYYLRANSASLFS